MNTKTAMRFDELALDKVPLASMLRTVHQSSGRRKVNNCGEDCGAGGGEGGELIGLSGGDGAG